MNKKNGVIKYFIGAIIIVALFIFFMGSFGKTDVNLEGQNGGGSSFVEGDGAIEGTPDGMEGNLSGDMSGGGELGGIEAMGESGAPVDTGDTGGADLGSMQAGGTPSLGSGGSGGSAALSGLGGQGSEGLDGDDKNGAGGDGSGAGAPISGTVGKETADSSGSPSGTDVNYSSTSGTGSKLTGAQGKNGSSTTIGSGSKNRSSKKNNKNSYKEDQGSESDNDETPKDEEPKVVEGGTYSSKEDVALYLHLYHKLPPNYITKAQAQQLGWGGGGLDAFAPGKCIGGDVFRNAEGKLPEGIGYHECDIDTLNASKRGSRRIVYSDDFHIYFTDDHYSKFELLYEP